MKIQMLCTVRPDLIFLEKPGIVLRVGKVYETVLRVGKVYEAVANPLGEVSGICENGERVGVKSGEFVIVEE